MPDYGIFINNKQESITLMMTSCVLLLHAFLFTGCSKSADGTEQSADQSVVIYCSVDQIYAEKLLAEFHKKYPRITVQTRFDTETTKTTGLVQRLRAERTNPQADLFWSSEIFQTIGLAKEGLLKSFDSPEVHDWPARYRDANRQWYAFGGRARVIAYDPARSDDPPASWSNLRNPKYMNRIAMADPVFGTTRGQVAVWYTLWGKDQTDQFLHQLKKNNINIVVSNSQTVRELLQGAVDFALTDTDDVWAANRNGNHLAVVYPRHGNGKNEGTLIIPNTLAFMKGRPESSAVRSLANFILSVDTERLLYESDSRNIPIIYTREIPVDAQFQVPDPLQVEYDVAADNMKTAVRSAVHILSGN